ncbi:hypothetical protein PSEUBRA_003399 [Kalmanozyma brasiliensis GHG001]|uniref:Uncharacterized protein n=1 Tax=Kalmanozyma brasiliensis (strain GHG001) TaxID=1365824 RepID=V5EVG0_KALBG|nr:uncharacterized protein PSEUBRA_003399 [Kalmanozyma brasiliensis GHG001]EST07228.1 hypothetical protein PSEUBRA_003399 [Kalmanozyma brasiliensis GHG001]
MSRPIRYAFPQRPAVVIVGLFAAAYFGRDNRDFANLFGGRQNIDKVLNLVVNLHIAEAVAMVGYCLYRGADLVTTLQYGVTQLIVGFPTYNVFKRLNG